MCHFPSAPHGGSANPGNVIIHQPHPNSSHLPIPASWSMADLSRCDKASVQGRPRRFFEELHGVRGQVKGQRTRTVLEDGLRIDHSEQAGVVFSCDQRDHKGKGIRREAEAKNVVARSVFRVCSGDVGSIDIRELSKARS